MITSADGLTRSATASNGIRVSLSVDKPMIKTGDDLTSTYTITNTTNTTISCVSQANEVEPEEIFGLLLGATVTITTSGDQWVDLLGGILVPAELTFASEPTFTLAAGASLTNTEILTGTQSGLGQMYVNTPPGSYKTSVVLGKICPTVEFNGPKLTVIE